MLHALQVYGEMACGQMAWVDQYHRTLQRYVVEDRHFPCKSENINWLGHNTGCDWSASNCGALTLQRHFCRSQTTFCPWACQWEHDIWRCLKLVGTWLLSHGHDTPACQQEKYGGALNRKLIKMPLTYLFKRLCPKQTVALIPNIINTQHTVPPLQTC